VTADDTAAHPWLDGVVDIAAVAVRALAYAGLAAFASNYDCGQALLAGLLAGDLAASLLATAWPGDGDRRQVAFELAVLGAAFLWVRHELVWPDDLAMRAILGLAAFGVFVGRAGSTLLTRLGPSENGFA
jgi:hypothetical protein